MINDIQILGGESFASGCSRQYIVAASATLIVPGEPVAVTLGGMTVTKMATNKPVVGTDFIPGIAVSTSTNTASVAGTVQVVPFEKNQLYQITPKVAITSQTTYDSYLGYRVLLDLTGTYPSDKYTGLVSDNSTSGFVIMPNDLSKNPGKIVFATRGGLSDLA